MHLIDSYHRKIVGLKIYKIIVCFRHGFLMWCTLGGYCGMAWIYDIIRIPSLVRDANEDPKFIEQYIEKLKKHPKVLCNVI